MDIILIFKKLFYLTNSLKLYYQVSTILLGRNKEWQFINSEVRIFHPFLRQDRKYIG